MPLDESDGLGEDSLSYYGIKYCQGALLPKLPYNGKEDWQKGYSIAGVVGGR